jgi:hypothetical protein
MEKWGYLSIFILSYSVVVIFAQRILLFPDLQNKFWMSGDPESIRSVVRNRHRPEFPSAADCWVPQYPGV